MVKYVWTVGFPGEGNQAVREELFHGAFRHSEFEVLSPVLGERAG